MLTTNDKRKLRVDSANDRLNDLPLTSSNALPVELSPGSIDAANRLRVSQQLTLGDYRQTNDNLPYFFDEETNGTATAVYDQSEGGVKMSVNADGDYAIRQSFQSHNYASGKSQLIEVTFTEMVPQQGVIKRQGYYTSNTSAPYDTLEGIYIESKDDTVRFKISKAGKDVLSVPQSQWNTDRFDGTGASGVTIDFNRFNVLVIDFLYLGGTQIRFGFIIDGIIQWAHKYTHSNVGTSTFVNYPSLPIRSEIRSTGGVGFMYQVCAQVSSEGSLGNVGRVRGFNTGTTGINATTIGTTYALLGIRLKPEYFNVSINPVTFSALVTTNDNFLLSLRFNPTIAGTFTYDDTVPGAVEFATGATANTVTGGEIISSLYGTANSSLIEQEESARRIGRAIDGTMDTLVLCITPLSTNLTAHGSLKIREEL